MINLQIAAGSIVGRDHMEIPKNNQDAYKYIIKDDLIIAIVCDGCGDLVDTVASEFGAILGVNLLTQTIMHHAQKRGLTRRGASRELIESQIFWERIRQEVLARMRLTALEMGEDFWTIVQSYFLFTTIGALITPEWSCFFSIGDGVIGINGEILQIGPFHDNEPPYLGFGLSTSGAQNPAFRFHLHSILKTEEIDSFFVGCDGVTQLIKISERLMPDGSNVGPISQFWEDDSYYSNTDTLRRKLKLINLEQAKMSSGPPPKELIKRRPLLRDDTTMIVGRRY